MNDISDEDMKFMIDLSKEVNGNDPVKIAKGVKNIIDYNEMVSNL